jgi:hypothetical protein
MGPRHTALYLCAKVFSGNAWSQPVPECSSDSGRFDARANGGGTRDENIGNLSDE